MSARTKSESVTVPAVVARLSRSRTARLASPRPRPRTRRRVVRARFADGRRRGRFEPWRAERTRRSSSSTRSTAASRRRRPGSRTSRAKPRNSGGNARRFDPSCGAARATLAATQRQLAFQLRTLYEQGQVDPLAVVFGATSLGTGLQSSTTSNGASPQAARSSPRHAPPSAGSSTRGEHSPRIRSGSLVRSRPHAPPSRASPAPPRASRPRRLPPRRLRPNMLSSAQSAVQKSQKYGSGTPTQPPPKSGTKMTVSATCYILKGTTASGLPTGPGVVAVDPTVIPLGTRMYIPGYGKGIAADIGRRDQGQDHRPLVLDVRRVRQVGPAHVTITIY